MILKDLHLRMLENYQNSGTGFTLFDTRSRVYTITSTSAANGYASAIVLPRQQFGTTVTFTCQARVVSGVSAKLEIHSHVSPYYGTVFDVRDMHTLTSTEWQAVTICCGFSTPNDAVYPRLNLEVNGVGTVEFRDMSLRLVADSFSLPNQDVKLSLEREYGSRIKGSQGVRSTISGDGVIDDTTSTNYINFSSTSGQAFLTIDDFAGFERNPNTEYYTIEVDAQVPAATKDAVMKFIFRNAAGSDVSLVCKLTPTIENGVSSSETYQTYRFFVVQDGSPSVIDEVEVEIGSLLNYEQDFNVRRVVMRGYGLSTLDLIQKELNSCCAVEKNGSVWGPDEDYRRENFTTVSEVDANTLQINYQYITGKALTPQLTMFNSAVVDPYVDSVSSTSSGAKYVRVKFANKSGTILSLASLSSGTKFFITAQS
jgi:hypothetical protein